MTTRIGIFLYLVPLLIGCRHQGIKNECDQLFVQSEVVKLGVEELYKEAIWQIYKFNLVEGDTFNIKNPQYIDSSYTETSLSEFDLELGMLEQKGDTISFVLFFERGVSPVGHQYYCSISFWGDKEKFEIGDRFIFTMERSMYEAEFKEYLLKNKEKLSPMLKCLSDERAAGKT